MNEAIRSPAYKRRPPQPLPNGPEDNWLTISLLAAVCAMVLASMEMWFFNQRLLGRLVHEDGLFENAEAASYFLASLILLHAVIVRRLRNIWVIGIALLFFLVGGEEISWGQRIFSIDTPEAFRSVNVQHETNIHNLEGLNGSVRALSLLVLWGLFVVIPVGTLFRPTERIIRWLALPVANWGSSIAIIVGTIYMIVARAFGQNVFQLDEIGELLVSLAALGLALTVWLSCGRRTEDVSSWHAPAFTAVAVRDPQAEWKPALG